MQYWPTWFEDDGAGVTTAILQKWAIKTVSVNGTFVKASVRGRKGSQRGLVMDSSVEFVSASGGGIKTFSRGTTIFAPFAGATNFIDGARHLKRGATRQQALNERGVNVLYCDGHAAEASIIEAWMSIRDPGGKDLSER
jgi:prepilin-type processing-associated H-X9-DG protein